MVGIATGSECFDVISDPLQGTEILLLVQIPAIFDELFQAIILIINRSREPISLTRICGCKSVFQRFEHLSETMGLPGKLPPVDGLMLFELCISSFSSV